MGNFLPIVSPPNLLKVKTFRVSLMRSGIRADRSWQHTKATSSQDGNIKKKKRKERLIRIRRRNCPGRTPGRAEQNEKSLWTVAVGSVQSNDESASCTGVACLKDMLLCSFSRDTEPKGGSDLRRILLSLFSSRLLVPILSGRLQPTGSVLSVRCCCCWSLLWCPASASLVHYTQHKKSQRTTIFGKLSF